MSQQLINRSPDLRRLRDEGYNVEVRHGFLLLRDVPYVNSARQVKRGILVSKLNLAGDVTAAPDDHVAFFIGEHPCNPDGSEIAQIKHGSANTTFAPDVVANHSFSSKPTTGAYRDYFEKMATYAAILSSRAAIIDPSATPRTFSAVSSGDMPTPFNYVDTASSRAEITAISEKLNLRRVAIIGLGGTGSYVLDLVAKTPVEEIVIVDGDLLLQHNAFRSPSAPSIEELRAVPSKVSYFKSIYSNMHKGIVAVPEFMDRTNLHLLDEADFAFLCLDAGDAKGFIIQRLEEKNIPFVDVGMGLYVADGALGGIVRVTTSTSQQRDHVRSKKRISLQQAANNEYSQNIQIADLNALNAALAVIKWKKLFGFYQDFEREHFSTYTIDGNKIINEDQP